MAFSSFLHPTSSVNLLITGPPESGKKSFIQALTGYNLLISESTEDVSSVYDNTFEVYGKSMMVTVWYVQNLGNSLDKIKEICLNQNASSVVLFCYAVDSPQSMKLLSKDYITLLRQQGKFHFLSLLVGNKVDVRVNGLRPCVQFHQGEDVKTSFHLSGFIECTAMMEQTVKSVFIKAVLIALGIEED